MVAAERAFAADGLGLGVRDSFLKHSAPEAIVFGPDVQKVHETFPRQDPDKGGPPLVWWPLWAGIARSGDLGFTTGPYSYDGKLRGYYFTVWKRQADGDSKWLYAVADALGGAGGGGQDLAAKDLERVALVLGQCGEVGVGVGGRRHRGSPVR
ncbi:hypothetical protein BH11PSE1_BH11PSE1_12940 [soil metagenome]